jgi:hypothetical protein
MVHQIDGWEMFETSGLNVERTMYPSGQWFAELCRLLQCPMGRAATIAWPVLLVPEIIDRRFAVSEKALQIYQRVEWADAVPDEPFQVGAWVEWASVRGPSVEAGLGSRAVVDGREVARNLLVIRAEGRADAFGERQVARPPSVGGKVRQRSFVITEEQVRHFGGLVGARYPIHDDVGYAQRLGFPNVLVQGVVLLLTQLHFAGQSFAGQAEMWFQRPVPVGSLLELSRCAENPNVWVLELVGSREVAAITRLVVPQ